MQDRKPMGSYIIINETKRTAQVSGIDNGPNVTVEAQNEHCIVLKFGGHNYFVALGSQGYAPAERAVFRIVERNEDNGVYRVVPMISYPTRRKTNQEEEAPC